MSTTFILLALVAILVLALVFSIVMLVNRKPHITLTQPRPVSPTVMETAGASDRPLTLLGSFEDWNEYMKGLDVETGYENNHVGIPTEFPALVRSRRSSDLMGKFTFSHEFMYRKDASRLRPDDLV